MSGVLGEAWGLYRAHFGQFFTVALAVFAIVQVITLLLVLILDALGALIGAFLLVGAYFWVQAAVVKVVEDVRDGRADLSVRDTLAAVWPRVPTVAITGIAAGIAIAIGLVLLLAPGLFLLTIWIAIIPVIVLENRRASESFGRSRELVRGHGWEVFGVVILTILVVLLANLAVSLLLLPFDETGQFLAQLISNTVIGPFAVVAWTLVYYRLREREAGAAVAAPAV